MSSLKANIAILLSTFNGGKYLEDFLYSVVNQTFLDFDLYISDDGSTDNTISIINHYAASFNNIHIINFGKSPKGAFGNFMNLLSIVDADFYFFADQDDIWVMDKVKIQIDRIVYLEKCFGKIPILVHSDLKVVDENLLLLSDSFNSFSNINPKLFKKSKYFYAVTNSVVGCSMCINKSVKELSFPINSKADMHDSWITISTIFNGGFIDYIPNKLVLYRQHQNNVIGARLSKGFKYLFFKFLNLGILISSNKSKYSLANSMDSNFSVLKYIYYKLYYLTFR